MIGRATTHSTNANTAIPASIRNAVAYSRCFSGQAADRRAQRRANALHCHDSAKAGIRMPVPARMRATNPGAAVTLPVIERFIAAELSA